MKLNIFVGACCLVMVVTTAAEAGVIATQSGNVNPTLQGWTSHPGPGVSVGPIDDGGTLIWSVSDGSRDAGSTWIYDQAVSNADVAVGNSNGWELHATLRLLWSDETEDGTIFAGYQDGTTAWQMNFGFDDSDNTVIKLFTDVSGPILGPTFVIPGHAIYHTFSLVYDPISGTADFLIDGIEQISNYTGFPATEQLVLFGAGRSPVGGTGKFQLLAFETNDQFLPEPSTFVLAGIGAFGVIALRRKRRRA